MIFTFIPEDIRYDLTPYICGIVMIGCLIKLNPINIECIRVPLLIKQNEEKENNKNKKNN